MKDLIRKRWFVFLLGILVAVVALLIVGRILYCNGYRIVYPKQFETSWDAVSGFAAWFGVGVSIVSAAASFFAIWFAVRVADKQNKIALFEKRYECYSVILKLIECSKWIERRTKNREIAISFRTIFDSEHQIEDYKKDFLTFTIRFDHLQVILIEGEFLFANYDVKMLQELIDTGFQLLHETWPDNLEDEKKEISESAKELKNKFCKACQEYKDTYLDKMSEELKLTKVK